ncbi:hypothetical protein IFM89_006333 [Coptis chinensis]|uniref:Prenyltransferase alpha-alpha toroid domain-containing protein n=1 Tax=Coptis chinensis TaxID=261450 RepID=A0A835IAJ8_9MAGN|nr:hypothetical protein IFM89_006333 [Coptis chinensis]
MEFNYGELEVEKHVQYILSVEKLETVDQDKVISWLLQCQDESGGFAGNIGHDPHVLYTLSAVQVLALFGKLHVLDIDKVSKCILLSVGLRSVKQCLKIYILQL